MKTKTLLSLVLGLASATSLVATPVHVYISGSTAFRSQVYNACTRLYVGGIPSGGIYFGTNSAVGGDANYNSSTAAWCMTGNNPVSTLTNIGNNTLIIHGLFNGSIQGIKSVVTEQRLLFATPSGNLVSNSVAGANTVVGGVGLYACNSFTTNRPTIGFSDSGNAACPYQVTANTAEEDVAVQPFVMTKSWGFGAAALAVSNINNVTWEQLEYGIPAGRIPLSAWTYKNSDTNNWVYLLQRTLDSGTRRVETAQQYFQYGDGVGIYIYDRTNNNWFLPSVTVNSTFGSAPNGVVGAAGLVNIDTGIPANLEWNYGYVGGGDIKNSLNITNSFNGVNIPATANQAIAYLSFNDAKGVGASNWANVVSFNGIWPTTDGANIHGHSGTNDFSPITSGFYTCWGKEVLVHVIDPASMVVNDQAITVTQLGDNTSPGTFLGVFNAQVGVTPGVTTTPLLGSIENEIELSKNGGAVAIRLSDMKSSRGSVGGVIAPF